MERMYQQQHNNRHLRTLGAVVLAFLRGNHLAPWSRPLLVSTPSTTGLGLASPLQPQQSNRHGERTESNAHGSRVRSDERRGYLGPDGQYTSAFLFAEVS